MARTTKSTGAKNAKRTSRSSDDAALKVAGKSRKGSPAAKSRQSSDKDTARTGGGRNSASEPQKRTIHGGRGRTGSKSNERK